MFVVVAQGFFEGVGDGLQRAWQDVLEFTPKLIGALLILLIGWFIARVIRGVISRILQRVGFDRLLERAGLTEALSRGGYTASGLLAGIIYWIALLITFLLASEALEVAQLSNLLRALIAYLPLLVVAIVILVVAAALGSFLSDLVRPYAEQQQIAWLAPLSRWAVLLFGVIIAFNTLNLAEEVVNILFMAVVGALAVAFAIAFGVGGIDTARRYWQRMGPREGA